jgi:hypothetical protein
MVATQFKLRIGIYAAEESLPIAGYGALNALYLNYIHTEMVHRLKSKDGKFVLKSIPQERRGDYSNPPAGSVSF